MMKLADETINPEETVSYGGEKFDRSTEHSHGELLTLIDFKRGRIQLHKTEFQGTINAMERNTKLAGAGVFVTLGCILFLIFIFFATERSGVFGIFFRIIVVLVICWLIYTEIIYIIKYLIHAKGICTAYADKHNILPAEKAITYCAKILSRLNICEQEIDKIETIIKNGNDVNVDELYHKLSEMDVEPKSVYDVIL